MEQSTFLEGCSAMVISVVVCGCFLWLGVSLCEVVSRARMRIKGCVMGENISGGEVCCGVVWWGMRRKGG